MRKSAVVGVVVGVVWGIYSFFIEIISLVGGGLHRVGGGLRIIFFPGWVLEGALPDSYN
jgi:ABC-type microcin C transport system permease subunit YejE